VGDAGLKPAGEVRPLIEPRGKLQMLDDGKGQVVGHCVRVKERFDVHVGEASQCKPLRDQCQKISRRRSGGGSQRIEDKLVERVAKSVIGEKLHGALPHKALARLATHGLQGTKFTFYDSAASHLRIYSHRRLRLHYSLCQKNRQLRFARVAS